MASSLIAGILQGMGQARMMASEREEKSAMRELQKEAIKLHIQTQKAGMEQTKFKQGIINMLLAGKQQAGTGGNATGTGSQAMPGETEQAAPAMPTTPMGENLLSALSGGQLAALGEASGIDFVGAARMEGDRAMNQYTKAKGVTRKETIGGKTYEWTEDPETGEILSPRRITAEAQPVMQRMAGEGGTVFEYPVDPFTRSPLPGAGAVPVERPTPVKRETSENGVTYEGFADPFTGAEVPGSKHVKQGKSAMAGETAGRFGLTQTGLLDLKRTRQALMPDGKNIDKFALATFTMRIPWSKGREARSFYDNAIEGKLRLESGAAVPETEVKRIGKRLGLSFLNSDSQNKEALNRLEEFLTGTVEVLDPNKTYGRNAYTFEAEGGKKMVVVPAQGAKRAPGESAADYLKRMGVK